MCVALVFSKGWHHAPTMLSAAKLTLFKAKMVSTRFSSGRFLTAIPSTVAEITRLATIRLTSSSLSSDVLARIVDGKSVVFS